MGALRQHLPTTFRVAGSRKYVYSLCSRARLIPPVCRIAKSLNNIIKNSHVPSLSDVIFEGENIPPPVQIPWYVETCVLHFVPLSQLSCKVS
jgi:multisite-specific tRNA:(cytosine-C5)-methyltransferase